MALAVSPPRSRLMRLSPRRPSECLVSCLRGGRLPENPEHMPNLRHRQGEAVHGHIDGLLVGPLGLPSAIAVAPADLHDLQGARRLLAGLQHVVPCLKTIWADAAYRGNELAD
jgi:hypothetical protein